MLHAQEAQHTLNRLASHTSRKVGGLSSHNSCTALHMLEQCTAFIQAINTASGRYGQLSSLKTIIFLGLPELTNQESRPRSLSRHWESHKHITHQVCMLVLGTCHSKKAKSVIHSRTTRSLLLPNSSFRCSRAEASSTALQQDL